ncbi:MFS transporter [Micromonospora sp. NPDC049301]|uniref:MFS transporter n=1 Tax=Micromonospora sp. NPDC049301 TaxID=3155723 RepID=UPI0034253DE1
MAELPPSVRAALLALFAVNAAAYVAFPLLAVKLATIDQLPPSQTGAVLTVFLVAARGSQMVAGPMADRYDPRLIMFAAALSRAVGFMGLGLASELQLLVVAAALAGAGGAFEPPVSGLLAAQPEPIRSRAFAMENAALNSGVIAGPALAAILVMAGTQVPFLASSLIFFLIAIRVLRIRTDRQPPIAHEPGVFAHARVAMTDRRFLVFWLIMLPWWFLFAQLSMAIPLRSHALAGAGWVGVLFLANGTAGMLSIPFVKLLQDRIGSRAATVAGHLCIAASMGMIAINPSPWWLLTCVVIFTVGETMILFSTRLILASFTGERTRASYFGLYAGSWALGGAAGNFVGARVAVDPLSPGPWLVFGATGLLAALICWVVLRRICSTTESVFEKSVVDGIAA